MRIAYIGEYHCIPFTVLFWSDTCQVKDMTDEDWIKALMGTNFYL